MSKRKQNRSERRASKVDRPNTIVRTPSVQSILFPAVLALAVSTAFLLQLSSPRSMVSAIRRVEYRAIEPDDGASTTGSQRGNAPGWRTVRAVFDAEVRKWPEITPHFALMQVLRDYSEVHRGSTEVSSILPRAAELAGHDADNLVMRLFWADLQDLAEANKGGARPATDPLERFEAYRWIVEGAKPASLVTLYNPKITEFWHDVLRQYIPHRRDVAVSLARTFYHDRITGQFEVLPVLQERLDALGEALRAGGKPSEAEVCLGWFRELCLGLMETDTDASTRLLCAELLAKSMEDYPEAVQRLVRLRADFHAHASAAPIDLADQSFVLRPAWRPEMVEPAMRWLLIAVALGLIGGGAAVVFFMAFIAGIAARIRHDGGKPASETARSWPVYITGPIALIPSLFAAWLLFVHYNHHGVFSETWGIATAINIAAIGGLATIALAGLFIKLQDVKQQRRAKLAGMLALLGFAALALPPEGVAWGVRYVDLLVSFLPVLIVLAFGLLCFSMWLTPARMRRIAAIAALLWCMNSCVAFVVYQVHRAADRKYQETVIDQGFDEMKARLGADWQEVYLAPVREALAEDTIP